MTVGLTAAGVGAVLLDIEGTTTPIAFVHDTLFSYARDNVARFLETHRHDADVEAALDGLRREHAVDVAAGQALPAWRDDDPHATLASAVSYIQWLIDRDRKSRWLKELQGRIWDDGYRAGTLRGEVYPDVPGALRRWAAAGVAAGIFSSGSVLAQKLLFGHSTAGDLTPLLRWHYDTAVGPKIEPASYRRIAENLSVPPATILFISDVTNELDAASAAGLQAVLCVRPPAVPPAGADRYRIVTTFDDIVP